MFSAELQLRQALHELGFTNTSVGLLQLWPDIVAAWSQGRITEAQQHRILDLSEEIPFDQTGWDLLRNWLSYRPPARAKEAGMEALTILRNLGYLPPNPGETRPAHFLGGWSNRLPADARGPARLTIDDQPVAFGLNRRDVEAGRARDCGIRLVGDTTVSRHHCVFHRSAKGWVVEDRASVAGTRVNGQRVLRRLLIGGEVVKIGRYKLHFTLEDPELDEPPTDQGA